MITLDIVCRSGQNYQVHINGGSHEFIVDEPLGVGDDAGPNPYDLLLSALGACSVITMEMYARRKNWPLESVVITLKTYKVYARGCADCDSDPGSRVDVIERAISLSGALSAEQQARLVEIADKCPIHRTLTSEVKIRTTLINNTTAG